MQGETRRILLAMVVALAVMIVYQIVINRILPPPKPIPPATATAPATAPAYAAPGISPTTSAPAAPGAAGPQTAAQPGFSFVSADDLRPLTLGGGASDPLQVELTPRGAGLIALQLTTRNKKGDYLYRAERGSAEPYKLLWPVEDGPRTHVSFSTHRIRINEHDRAYSLHDVVWHAAQSGPNRAEFTTTLRGDDGRDLLHLTKTYQLLDGKPVFEFALTVGNVSSTPLTVVLEQDGPLGIRHEDPQRDERRLLATQVTDGKVELNRAQDWNALQKATLDPLAGHVNLLSAQRGPFVWTALSNKYFAVFTRPVTAAEGGPGPIAGAVGLVAAPNLPLMPGDPCARGDLLARLVSKAEPLSPGAAAQFRFEVYAGPKDVDHVRQAHATYADQYRYQLAQTVDATCCPCQFLWLQELMVWLLEKIHAVVRNYGVAIIVLVIIVRSLLHPLAVWQQKSMYRTQEAMGRVQPKMEAIREKYANDKVRQNQEMMKLWADEGVNPAANFVAFIPLFIQTPILIALWQALNTDVHLRHAPFDGYWITDLSAPDALIRFPQPIHIPLLSWFMGEISSLNLLPVIMGVSMWLQQKYMPKPRHVQERLEATRGKPAPSAPRRAGSMTPEEQLRQQQIMSYMMSIFFPLMFYKMPSGLNLYWLATNVFGICESLIIRRQIDAERQRREAEGPAPAPAKRPRSGGGLLSRFLSHIASQAEELQRKADELAKTETPRKKDGRKK